MDRITSMTAFTTVVAAGSFADYLGATKEAWQARRDVRSEDAAK